MMTREEKTIAKLAKLSDYVRVLDGQIRWADLPNISYCHNIEINLPGLFRDFKLCTSGLERDITDPLLAELKDVIKRHRQLCTERLAACKAELVEAPNDGA